MLKTRVYDGIHHLGEELTSFARLPLLMAIWGTIACCHAACKNYAQLLVLRILLGFFESGFFVCITLSLSYVIWALGAK
jgi:MFS family permease